MIKFFLFRVRAHAVTLVIFFQVTEKGSKRLSWIINLYLAVYFYDVVLYFDEPAGRDKIQTTSKIIRRCFTSKHLIRDLLSNFTFLNLFSNLKENYKCNRMSARTVQYNNQLYNIVEYLYLFCALSVH